MNLTLSMQWFSSAHHNEDRRENALMNTENGSIIYPELTQEQQNEVRIWDSQESERRGTKNG